MDKSYIIRVYKRDNETASGVVEDVEGCKRTSFSDANQLWSLIMDYTEHESSNVVALKKSI